MNYDGAKGWMVGEENKGLAAMFVMMNAARLGVGIQGLGQADVAFQNAVAYAQDRRQGRALTGPQDPQEKADPLFVHPDVRRMLMDAKATVEAVRDMNPELAMLVEGRLALAQGRFADAVSIIDQLIRNEDIGSELRTQALDTQARAQVALGKVEIGASGLETMGSADDDQRVEMRLVAIDVLFFGGRDRDAATLAGELPINATTSALLIDQSLARARLLKSQSRPQSSILPLFSTC